MNELFRQADRIPVTLLIAIAYITLAFLTDPFHPTGKQLASFGWLTPFAVAHGEPWRLLSNAFLHGGIVHLGFNTIALLGIGPSLELTLGSLRFALLYLISALGGSLAVCMLYPFDQPVLGGSGALFGMFGAILAINMRSGRHLFSFLDFDGPRRIVSLIAINLLISMVVPMISNTAHIGGLFSGFLLTFLWLQPGRSPGTLQRHWRTALVALFASFSFWSLEPATRADKLWNDSIGQPEPMAGARRRAAAMSWYRLPAADENDVLRLQRELLR